MISICATGIFNNVVLRLGLETYHNKQVIMTLLVSGGAFPGKAEVVNIFDNFCVCNESGHIGNNITEYK